jgi:hypothetical protein
MLFCEIKLLNLKLTRIKRENASKKDYRDRVVYIKKYLFPGEGRGYIGPCYVGGKYEKR